MFNVVTAENFLTWGAAENVIFKSVLPIFRIYPEIRTFSNLAEVVLGIFWKIRTLLRLLGGEKSPGSGLDKSSGSVAVRQSLKWHFRLPQCWHPNSQWKWIFFLRASRAQCFKKINMCNCFAMDRWVSQFFTSFCYTIFTARIDRVTFKMLSDARACFEKYSWSLYFTSCW